MSKLIINYTNSQKEIINITGYDLFASPQFLKIKKGDSLVEYIPLCVIKSFTIDGYKIIKGA